MFLKVFTTCLFVCLPLYAFALSPALLYDPYGIYMSDREKSIYLLGVTDGISCTIKVLSIPEILSDPVAFPIEIDKCIENMISEKYISD